MNVEMSLDKNHIKELWVDPFRNNYCGSSSGQDKELDNDIILNRWREIFSSR